MSAPPLGARRTGGRRPGPGRLQQLALEVGQLDLDLDHGRPSRLGSTTVDDGRPVFVDHHEWRGDELQHQGGVGTRGGAAGTITGTIIVTNVGSTPCTVNGYPTMSLTSGSGAPLTVTIVNGLTVNVSPQANAGPVLGDDPRPTARPSSPTSTPTCPTGAETSCPSSEAASVTLPNGGGSSPGFAFDGVSL